MTGRNLLEDVKEEEQKSSTFAESVNPTGFDQPQEIIFCHKYRIYPDGKMYHVSSWEAGRKQFKKKEVKKEKRISYSTKLDEDGM